MTVAPEILYEEYGELEELSPAELKDAIGSAPLRVPASWRSDRGYRTTLATVVRRAGATPQRTETPIVYLMYSRPPERLQIQFLEIVDEVAGLYADSILAQGMPGSVPLGRGFAEGQSAAIESGSHFIRATYNDGRAGHPSAGADRTRHEVLAKGARQLLAELQPR